jgi:hypothetical protein
VRTTSENERGRSGPAGIHLRRLLVGVAPIGVSIMYVWYMHAVHMHIVFDGDAWQPPLVLAMLPPLLLELVMTRQFEVRRFGWTRRVLLGLAGRLGFLLAWMCVFFWYARAFNNTQGYVVTELGKWPHVAELFLRSNPLPMIIGTAVAVVLYAAVTVPYRRFRFTTTILLPLIAALTSFGLYYFQPTNILARPHPPRPAGVEAVFPSPRYAPLVAEMGRAAYYSRDLYVQRDDRWLVASFGGTFPFDIDHLVNFIWLDLNGDEYHAFHQPAVGNSTRRFDSDCPDAFYVVPWGRNILEEYKPGESNITEYPLPDDVDGMALLRHSDPMFVHHACDEERAYVLLSRTPSLLSWDTRRREWDRTLGLARAAGAIVGGSAAVVRRNRQRGVLYVDEGPLPNRLIEIDERAWNVRRIAPLPEDVFEVAVAPDGRYLYAATFFGFDFLKIDADTLEVIDRIPGAYHSRKLVFTHDGRWLIGGSYVYGNVVVVDTATGQQLLSFWVSPKIEGVSVSDRYCYVFGADGIFRVSLDDLQRMIDRGDTPEWTTGPPRAVARDISAH